MENELISRMEKAEGPSMELARIIQCQYGGWHRVTPSQLGKKHGGFIAPQDWIGQHSNGAPILDSLHGTDIHRDVPDCLSSIDAAVAFAERVLPDINVWGLEFERGKCEATVQRNGVAPGHWAYFAVHAVPAIAICIAALKALKAREVAV